MSVEELTKEQVQMLRKAFDMFDREKRGCIHTNMVSTILRTLGQSFEEKELQALIKEIDADGKQTNLMRHQILPITRLEQMANQLISLTSRA
jgi:Ca2+-binding EF-hand superfamily protein